MATMKDLALGVAADLLRENGRLDRLAGKDKDTGWAELCRDGGYSEGRTPAREAYEDGYETP